MGIKNTLLASASVAALLFVSAVCHHAATTTAAAPTSPVATTPVGTPLPTLTSPSGKKYERSHVAPPDEDEPVTIPPVPHGAAPNMDNFNGTARKAAKLSIGTGPTQSFTAIGAVLDSLPCDASMRAKHIDKSATSGRLPEEQKLVTVTAFLYAASRESDNDFHCIMGRDPSLPARYMNVEVSALPPSSSAAFATIRAARNQFKAFFTSNSDALPGPGYDKFDPPIPVKITGSVFFDVDHVPPAVGPTGMKPQSAWEIHLVSDLVFEQ